MPDFVLILKLLGLLTVANGAPVVAKKLLGTRWSRPLDGGMRFVDDRPLFGPSKTQRGLLLSIGMSGLVAPMLGWSIVVGALFGALAMAGDLLSSFAKRRMGLPSSSMALGLDQIPESLLPLLGLYAVLEIGVVEASLVVVLFFAGELVASRILYQVNLRDRPY